MHSIPGKVGCVLMPWGAAAFAIFFEEDLFGEIPDVFRAPEIGEQFAKRNRRNQFVQPFRGSGVRVLVMRFLFGSRKEFDGQRTGVLDAPIVNGSASRQLLSVEKSFDQDSAVFD